LSAALLLSCSKLSEEHKISSPGMVTLSANCADSGAKVMLNSAGKTVWLEGDSVSVFYGGSRSNVKALFTGTEGSQTGSICFKDSSKIAVGNTLAAIPYRQDNSLSDNVLHCCVPSVQHYVKGSYDPSAALLVASSSTDVLNFHYACAVLYVDICPSGKQSMEIKSITLSSASGESIAGGVAVDMCNPDKPTMQVEKDGSDKIQLCSYDPSQPLCSVSGGESERFYFCVAAVALSKGYEFDILLANGTHVVSRNTLARSLEAGTLSGIKCSYSEPLSIIIDFNENVFSPSIPTSATTGADKTYSFTNASDGKTYSICAYQNNSGHFLRTVDGYKCLRFNDPGSYLGLPTIEGLTLTRFGAMVRQNGSKPLAVSSTKSSDGDIVPSVSYKNATMTYTIANAQQDSPLYLYMGSNNTQLSRIELYFE